MVASSLSFISVSLFPLLDEYQVRRERIRTSGMLCMPGFLDQVLGEGSSFSSEATGLWEIFGHRPNSLRAFFFPTEEKCKGKRELELRVKHGMFS